MTAHPSAAARAAARALVPLNPGAKALVRTRRFLDDNVIDPGTPGEPTTFDGTFWDGTKDRSRLRRLHGWLFVSDWCSAHDLLPADGRARLADAAAVVVRDWARRFADPSGSPAMAYHDETTAQRLLRMAALGDTVLADHDDRALLSSLALNTAELIATEEFHAGNNNHGMFQDTALVAFAVLSDAPSASRRAELLQLGLNRFEAYLDMCFTPEGVHIEHSPSYHLMVVRGIAAMAQLVGELDMPHLANRLRDLVSRAETYATHALSPRGVFPPVSDTVQTPVRSLSNLAVFTSAAFRFAATRGAEGSPPTELAAVFPTSGYATYRSSWGDPEALFCFFTAAYNGGYHKHSDDLSLHVEVAGTEVLREAGPHGYTYADPFTEYGYSSFAHNTLVVDDRGLPRHDGRTDETWLEDLGSTPSRLDVRGVTTRFDGVRFSRHLTVGGPGDEGSTVRVVDRVSSADEHRYTFWWHLGPDVEPVVHSDHVELFVRGRKVLELSVRADHPFEIRVDRGRTEPRPAGWMFPTMGTRRPTWTLSLTIYATECTVETTIRTTTFQLRDRGVRPEPGEWVGRRGSVPLTYLLDDPDGTAEALVVAFSAVHQPRDFTYNYRATLDGLNMARLFVLDDFGDQGAYYYSRSRGLGPFVAVQALIRDVLDRLGLPPSSLQTVGSSKGGTAALIHGLAAGAGHVVAGAPQTRVGSFLQLAHPDVLTYMSGGSGQADVLWADDILERVLRDASASTTVSVLVGDADHHLRGHVEPFVRVARQHGLTVNDLVIPGTPHGRIGASFRQYLRSHLEWSAGADTLPHCLSTDGAHDLVLSLGGDPGASVSTKLYRGAEVVASSGYRPQETARWSGLPAGEYRVRVYVRPGRGGAPQMAFTTARVRVGLP